MIVTHFRRRVVTRRGLELRVRRGRLLQNVLGDVPQTDEGILTHGTEPVTGDVATWR